MNKYAILMNKQLYNSISHLVNADELVYLDIANYEIVKAVSRLTLVNVDKLIIDLSGMTDRDRFKSSITQFRIINRDAHIILITPNKSIPEVQQAIELGINDIIEADPDNFDAEQLRQAIADAIAQGSTGELKIRTASTITIKQEDTPTRIDAPEKPTIKAKERVITKKVVEYIERPVEVIKEVPIMLGKRIIGVFSCARGSGCTSIAVRIAELISEHGRTACITVDGSDDIANIKGHADYIVSSVDELGHYVSDYEYIVIDFGCIFPYAGSKLDLERIQEYRKYYIELQRCDIKICTAFTADWHRKRLKMLLEIRETAVIFNDCNIILDKPRNIFNNESINILNRDSLTDEIIIKIVLPEISGYKSKKRKWKFRI